MAERTKQTRLEELDLRAKSLLEAWSKDTFGQRQQAAAGVNDSTLPFKRFAADHHKRRTESQIQASAIEAYKDGGYDAFFKEVDESNRTDPPTLEERWDKSAFKGGPANEAKGGGSSTSAINPKLTSPRPYEGEQNGQLSIKFLEQDYFVPDSPFNRDLWEKFGTTFTSGKPDEDGKNYYDYFFQLADVVGEPSFGNSTIRAHWEKIFGDGNAPSIQATKVIRRNQWSQQDINIQYDEDKKYKLTDSYYRYDVATPDLEFGNADDPLTKQNHQSFTLRRKDANTIELATNIQRATVQNPSGAQWPNRSANGKSIFNRASDYNYTDSYYRYNVETPDLEFGNADDPLAKANHQSAYLGGNEAKERPPNTTLATNIQRATVQNASGVQWPNKTEHGSSTFARGNEYNNSFTRSNTYVYRGRTFKQDNNVDIEVTPLGWPDVTGVSPNINPFGNNRRARNLEELWFSLANLKADGPPTDQAQRSGQSIRLSSFFSADRISNLDYKVRFLGALNGSFANVPDSSDVDNQGAAGFNVGQVQPYNKRTGEYQFGDGREMDMYDSGRLHRILSTINGYEQELMEIKPGGNRINIVFNIRVNLEKLLQQNLLMPTDLYPAQGNPYTGYRTTDLATAIEEGTSSTLDDDTFTKLYLENRSALHAKDRGNHARTPPGTIAGVPVADLQGPVTPQSYDGPGKYKTGNANDDNTVFKFKDEDGPQGRNNTITQDRGFIDNIAGQVHGNRQGIAGLMPAVENDGANSTGGQNEFQNQTTFLKTRTRANEQFFPFMFETINKRGSARNGVEYKQYAYFQATLQSLNESYAPAWSSKHFFGRTEQIHTYTMTERSIDFSFVIFATEIRRLQNLYERVSWLAQQTYPSYDASNRLKSGPLIKMTIGDMFSGLNGFIRSLSFDWNYLGPGGKWEITQGLRIPMACTVSINFTVMHDNMPDRNYNLYPGPIRGGKGLIGERGESQAHPEGGPLISTASRAKRSDDAKEAIWNDQQNRFDLTSRNNETRQRARQYLNQQRELAARGGGVTQQYIDWVNQNTSLGKPTSDGTQYINAAGDIDLVFD